MISITFFLCVFNFFSNKIKIYKEKNLNYILKINYIVYIKESP